MTPYQPRTGARCTCKRGQQRDNCPTCEGTGWVIDFALIRAQVAITEQIVSELIEEERTP